MTTTPNRNRERWWIVSATIINILLPAAPAHLKQVNPLTTLIPSALLGPCDSHDDFGMYDFLLRLRFIPRQPSL